VDGARSWRGKRLSQEGSRRRRRDRGRRPCDGTAAFSGAPRTKAIEARGEHDVDGGLGNRSSSQLIEDVLAFAGAIVALLMPSLVLVLVVLLLGSFSCGPPRQAAA